MKKRLKIFLSSTMKDLGPEREIAARAIEALRLEAVRAETFGAHPGTPADICMEMVRDCDVFVGIYGGRYGYVPQGQTVSATELEFLEARRNGKDILVYIKDAVDREPLQIDFLSRADDFEGGYFRRPAFRTITELEEWIKEDLIALLSSRFITKNQPPAKTTRDSYKTYVTALYGNLSFSGVAQTASGLEIPLSEVYINPIVRPVSQKNSATIKPLNVNDVLFDNHHIVIFGAPGIGKTVLLKQLAIEAAQGILPSGEELLPILIPLASWSSNAVQGHALVNLKTYIEDFISSRADPQFAPVIKHAIDTGAAIVLLDGLDEIDREDSRMMVLNGVSEFTNRYPGVKVILTTRPFTNAQVPGFSAYEILPWTDQQISRFLLRWSNSLNNSLGLSVNSEMQATEIMHALSANAGLRELASTPLLLTLLAFVHRQAYRLPTRRVELYEAATRTMLGSWDRARSLSHTLPRRFEPAAVERILSTIALEMSERDVSAIERDEAIKIAQLSLSLSDNELRQFSSLLDELSNNSAILAFQGPATISFVHRIFQEFFAAKAIAGMDDPQALAFITTHYFEPRYEEIIRLALSWMDVHGGRHGLVSRAAEELINASGI